MKNAEQFIEKLAKTFQSASKQGVENIIAGLAEHISESVSDELLSKIEADGFSHISYSGEDGGGIYVSLSGSEDLAAHFSWKEFEETSLEIDDPKDLRRLAKHCMSLAKKAQAEATRIEEFRKRNERI